MSTAHIPSGWKADRPSGLSVALVLLSLYVVADGLSNVTRGVELPLLTFIAVLGAAVGIALAWGQISGPALPLLATAAGVAAILIRVGRIGDQLRDLGLAALGVAAATISPWYSANIGFDNQSRLAQAWAELSELIGVLLMRTSDWFTGMASGIPRFDPVVAALLWTAVIWSIAWWAGWAVQSRKAPLVALVPAVGVLAMVLSRLGAKSGPLLWALGISILVIVLVPHEERRRRWLKMGISIPAAQRRNLITWAAILALGLVSVGGLSQQLTYRKVAQLIEDLTSDSTPRDALALQAVGLEKQDQAESSEAANLELVRSPGLPRRQLIGSGPELSERLALMVRVEEADRELLSEAGAPVSDYYWRSYTYDVYTGRGWETGETTRIEYPPGASTMAEVPPTHRTVSLSVRTVPKLRGLLFSAGELLSSDQSYRVDWRSPGDAFGAVKLNPTTRSKVESVLLEATPDDLRQSGSEYPQWIEEMYLTVPETLPSRVVGLARDLTATSATPYDRAAAIERYLREFEYSLDVGAPPPNRDVVDYFLFDLEKGYCDYFASSMVVLARASGLPARLVVGYVAGKYDAELDAFLTTEAEAHSWPEIYFPGYGWVEFEPTSGRPSLTPAEQAPTPDASFFDVPEGSAGQESSSIPFELPSAFQSLIGIVMVLVLALTSVSGLAWLALRRWRLRGRSTPQVIEHSYRSLVRASEAMNVPQPNAMTPYELRSALLKRLGREASGPIRERVVRPSTQEIRKLTETYIAANYSPLPPDPGQRSAIASMWRRLRWRLWILRIAAKFGAE